MLLFERLDNRDLTHGQMGHRFFRPADAFDHFGCLPWYRRRGVKILLTCNSNLPSTVKCLYDLPSYADGWLYPQYTSSWYPAY